MNAVTNEIKIDMERHGACSVLLANFRSGTIVAEFDQASSTLMAWVRGTKTVAVWTLGDIRKAIECEWFSLGWAVGAKKATAGQHDQIDFDALALWQMAAMAVELGVEVTS